MATPGSQAHPKGHARAALEEALADFEEDPLRFHEAEACCRGGRPLGCGEVDGSTACARPTEDRFAAARKGVRGPLRPRLLKSLEL